MGAAAVAGALHPSIAYAIRLAVLTGCAAEAEELEAMVDRLLGHHDVWDGSDLARSGLPFELAFASADPHTLRMTVDASSVSRALALYDELAPARLPEDVRRAIAAVPPRSAYLGVRWQRHHVAAVTPQLKLYVNTHVWPRPPIDLPVAAHLTMVAYDGASDRVERYYRAEALGIGGVMSLLGARAADVLDLLAEGVGRPLRGALPSCDFGFSIAARRGSGDAPRITLYGFAGSLFGSDARCRTAILRLGDAHRWSFPLYERVSEPLRAARGPAMHHGMFGIVADAEPSITFGLAPRAEVT
ncbi:MAG TPA: hypothetical protein VF846_12805 [Thermoanaerobaculia bacterium]|jgi:hypothetical protein